MTFRVTGMNIRTLPANRAGSVIKAHFDAHNDEIGFRGCVLAVSCDGSWRVWTPNIFDLTGSERRAAGKAVWLRDGSPMYEALYAAALATYQTMVPRAPRPVDPAIEDSLAEAGLAS